MWWAKWKRVVWAAAVILVAAPIAKPLSRFFDNMAKTAEAGNPLPLVFVLSVVLMVLFVARLADRRECPYCKGGISGRATKCRHCGSDV